MRNQVLQTQNRLCCFAHSEQLTNTPLNWLEEYKAAFLEEMLTVHGQLKVTENRLTELWGYFVFSAIVFGHICGPSALASLARLKWGDVFCAAEGYLLLPRRGGYVPVFVPQIVQVWAISLCMHRMRGRGAGRKRLGVFPRDGLVFPSWQESNQSPKAEDIHRTKRCFAGWLRRFAARNGLPRISTSRLLALLSWHLQYVYSSPVAGTLTGLTYYNPAPMTQLDLLDSYRRSMEIPPIPSDEASVAVRSARPRICIRKNSKDENPQIENVGISRLDYLDSIREILRGFQGLLPQKIRKHRHKVARELVELAQTLVAGSSCTNTPSDNIKVANGSYVAGWLAALAKRCSPLIMCSLILPLLSA